MQHISPKRPGNPGICTVSKPDGRQTCREGLKSVIKNWWIYAFINFQCDVAQRDEFYEKY